MDLELFGYDDVGTPVWRRAGWLLEQQVGLWHWADFPDWRGPLPGELEDFVAWDAWRQAWLLEIELGRVA